MISDEDIITEYTLAASKAEGHPRNISNVRVLRIDKHTFVMTEVESSGRTFLLKLAEAFPGYSGYDISPVVIVLQTRVQIVKQVSEFVDAKNAEEAA